MAGVIKRFITVILSRKGRLSRMFLDWLFRPKPPLFPDKKKAACEGSQTTGQRVFIDIANNLSHNENVRKAGTQ